MSDDVGDESSSDNDILFFNNENNDTKVVDPVELEEENIFSDHIISEATLIDITG